MSKLPEIDSAKVEQKLLGRLSEAISHGVKLEALAEALRDERDEARVERDTYKGQLDQIRAELDAKQDSPDETPEEK